MTPDEIERAIEFIVQQQARSEALYERTQTQIVELAKQHRTMGQMFESRDRRMHAAIDRLIESVRALVEHSRVTDLRLDGLEGQQG